MHIVKADGVIKSYNHGITNKINGEKEYPVLKGIDLNIEKEDFIGIMGRSGCGKTTLLKILGTIDKPTRGKIYYGDKDIRKLNADHLAELRRNRIGFVFQDFNLMNHLTVEENIILPLVLNKLPYKNMKRIVETNARNLGIGHLLKKNIYELSGGEKQRVAIARALSNDPEIIFADEPTGNLDLASALNIMQCFVKINSEGHRAVVLVTHDPHIASYCKKIYFLDEGKIGWSCVKGGNQDDFYDEIMHRHLTILP
ncbi:MAG: ABC transporter ATP-binding protein [Blautia sp.]|nr:ABC transporter ATP-binding protein [Blautia sp.]